MTSSWSLLFNHIGRVYCSAQTESLNRIWINRTLEQIHIALYASYADIPKINFKIFAQNSAIPEQLKDFYNSVFKTENSTQMLFLFPLIANSKPFTSHHLTLSTSKTFTFLPTNFYHWEERAMPENLQSSKCFFLSPRNSSASYTTPPFGLFRICFEPNNSSEQPFRYEIQMKIKNICHPHIYE